MERRAGKLQHISELVQEKNIILRGSDILSHSGFTQVPNHILKSDKISPGAKLAYTMLLSYAWHNDFCFPGQNRLSVDMGCSIRSANTYIQELNTKKFISIKRRGQGRTNIYELNLVASVKGKKK